MSWAVSNIAASFAGTGSAERVQSKHKKKEERIGSPRDIRDEFKPAEKVEDPDTVRSLKDNSQEEAHEDREQHGSDFAVQNATHNRRPIEEDDQAVYGQTEPRFSTRSALDVDA